MYSRTFFGPTTALFYKHSKMNLMNNDPTFLYHIAIPYCMLSENCTAFYLTQVVPNNIMSLVFTFAVIYCIWQVSALTQATLWPEMQLSVTARPLGLQQRHYVFEWLTLWPISGPPHQQLGHFLVAGPLHTTLCEPQQCPMHTKEVCLIWKDPL
jgi:hypothetical protein